MSTWFEIILLILLFIHVYDYQQRTKVFEHIANTLRSNKKEAKQQ